MKILRRHGKFKDTEKVIRYHPFDIGIGTDIVFDISVPESTAGSTDIPKYRISFAIRKFPARLVQRPGRKAFPTF